jgi:predicted Zn-dependent protease
MLAPVPAGDQTQAVTAAPAAPQAASAARPWPVRLGAALGRHLRRRRRFWAAAALLALAAAGLVPAVPQVRAWQHLRAARADLERYHNAQAVRHLQACLRTWPDSPEVLLLAARAARRAKAHDEADRCLDKYQRARGLDDAVALERLLLAAERGGDEQTMALCRRYVDEGHPDTPLILEAVTRGFLRQYRLRDARLCLDTWLGLQPDNPQALCLMGQFHLDYERDRSAALAKYRRAVEVDPDHEEARLGLAVALVEAKNYAEAAENLEELRRRQPDNLRALVAIAECRDGLGDSAGAVRQVDEVLARAPDYTAALAFRGRYALLRGQYAPAETWLSQAVAGNPRDHNARYNLILVLHRLGKEEEAREHEKRLKQMEVDVKRFNEIVTKDMSKGPNDPALHCELGELLLRSGHRDEGLRWLHSALRLDADYAPARKALAEYAQQARAGQQRAEGGKQ